MDSEKTQEHDEKPRKELTAEQNTNTSKKTIVLALIGALIGMSGAFFSGVYVGFENSPAVLQVANVFNKQTNAPANVDFEPFWKAWNVINEKYVGAEEVSEQDKVWGAVSGLATSLGDPYTVFFPPKQNKAFAESIEGNFQGVGIEVGMRDDVLTIIAPLKGTPAYRAGAQPEDRIIKIDDTVTANLTIDDAVQLIRGKKGTEVVLTIFRKDVDEPIELKIIRDFIDIPTIETEFTDDSGTVNQSGLGLRYDGVYVIRLFNFSAPSAQKFREALRNFIDSNSNKLIIDLRGNPGGFLESAVDMASWFLPAGKVVVRESIGIGGESRIYRSKGYDIFTDKLKVVILVNGGSASASEILAGALKEHGIATIVGTQTFGKGSVQELVPITHNEFDTAIKITVAQWLTPEGKSISKLGIEPDVVVELTREDVEAGKDLQMEKAVNILLGIDKIDIPKSESL